MENLLYFFLFHYGIMFILKKNNIVRRLNTLSRMTRRFSKLSEFIYDVSECNFCLSHHIGLLIIITLFFIFKLDYIYLTYPLMSSSIMNIIQRLSNE